MEMIVLKTILDVSYRVTYSHFGKHVYVPNSMEWTDAQAFCRGMFTDLSPITTPWDEAALKNVTDGRVFGKFWIGLYKDATGQWMWSGGGLATTWAATQPVTLLGGKYVSVCWHMCLIEGWYSLLPQQLPFLCLSLYVIEKQVTWEEAIWNCRETHYTLTSLVSEAENRLALREIQDRNITDPVWIGLRYLFQTWLWVDGSPLVYTAGPQGKDQDYQCPTQSNCAALTSNGVWVALDCKKQLNFICE